MEVRPIDGNALIERLNGLYTALRKEGEQKYSPEINTVAFVLMDAASALSTLQAENEKLREMYQKEKAVCHAVQAELENYRKGHCAEGGCAAEKDRDAVLAELERVKRERDAAVEDLHKLCPAWKWDGEEG